MKQATMIGYITLFFIVLLVTSIEDAVAQQVDELTRQCLTEVREIMKREGFKQLGAADQRKVSEYCKQGEVKRAIRLVRAIGTSRRCTRDLNDHIKHNNLDVDKGLLGRAYRSCRRGDLQKAIEVVDGAPTKVPAAPAEIISFVASTSKVKKGSSVTLSWRTANAHTVMLGRVGANDFQNVPTSGSRSVSPDKTTTYVLMVGQSTKGPTKMKSKTLQVGIIHDPVIGRFYASPSTIRRGLESKLTWEVYAADDVTLNGIPVPPIGEKTVSPKRTKNYTLMVRTGDKIIKEHYTVHVSPFYPPKLSPAFYSVELCQKIDNSGKSFRCISPDGPFWKGNKIHVIVRFKDLSRGQHKVERIIYNSGIFGSDKWKRIHREESSFQNPRRGYAEITFEIPSLVKGILELKLVLDNKKNTKSVVRYCIECPGHDEW